MQGSGLNLMPLSMASNGRCCAANNQREAVLFFNFTIAVYAGIVTKTSHGRHKLRETAVLPSRFPSVGGGSHPPGHRIRKITHRVCYTIGMNRRNFLLLGVLSALLVAATAVTAQYPLAQEPENAIYLPLITRPPDPQIITFQVEPDSADPGQTVLLSWEVENANRVVLTRFWDYRPAEWWDYLPLIGTHSHTVPDWERNPIYFSLDAYNTLTGAHLTASVTIHVICPDTWFFTPAPSGCPSAPLTSPAAEQPFEGGFMVWVGVQDRIIVLFDDGLYPKMSNYSDEWDGGPICDEGPPPPGLVHPTGGFGNLWCNDAAVRDRLGWGLEPEVGYDTILQWTTLVKYNHTYLRAADGNVWHLLPENSGWEKILVDP